MNWTQQALPGSFCHIPGLVHYLNGAATGTSEKWGPVHLTVDPRSTRYGDFFGDGDEVAAVHVGCDNGGGTADGQLVDSYVVVRSSAGTLHAIGVIVPQMAAVPGVHVPLLSGADFAAGKITVHEVWYRHYDGTCCPSGRAITVWALQNGALVAGHPSVTS
ncbi:MAG TPA: hypothetical protein VH008_15420 [Pseudonocardia sp.]|nr:hypothetical protein [Pseudonocardia sp.]